MAFAGDADYVSTRWRADPEAAFAVAMEGELIAANFATCWGSLGFFGPLVVHPNAWDRGIGRQLVAAAVDLLERRGTRHQGLFTFAQSPKHLALYQKFGFWPRFLTALMTLPVAGDGGEVGGSLYSEAPAGEREGALDPCRTLTSAILPGLDVEREIRAVDAQGLGETLLLRDGEDLAGLAVCHCGPGSEGGSGTCYVKFGAARPGPGAEERFGRLLDACAAVAARKGLSRLTAGANTGRAAAYRQMLARGFRLEFQGIAMHRPDEPAYNRPDVFLLDDWR
jgi:hypothetical protein